MLSRVSRCFPFSSLFTLGNKKKSAGAIEGLWHRWNTDPGQIGVDNEGGVTRRVVMVESPWRPDLWPDAGGSVIESFENFFLEVLVDGLPRWYKLVVHDSLSVEEHDDVGIAHSCFLLTRWRGRVPFRTLHFRIQRSITHLLWCCQGNLGPPHRVQAARSILPRAAVFERLISNLRAKWKN